MMRECVCAACAAKSEENTRSNPREFGTELSCVCSGVS